LTARLPLINDYRNVKHPVARLSIALERTKSGNRLLFHAFQSRQHEKNALALNIT